MSGVYFSKILPIVGVRYRLTDKRLMILRGWKGAISQQVPLADIDDVQLDPDTIDQFFRSADLKVLRNGQVAMKCTH